MIKGLVIAIIAVGVLLLPTVGYVKNVFKFIDSDFEAPYKSEIVRAVGIPVPIVGVIAGFMDIGDEK
jgi:hypothetical protein